MSSLAILGDDARGRQTTGFGFTAGGTLGFTAGALCGFRLVIQRKTLQVQSRVHGGNGRIRLEF